MIEVENLSKRFVSTTAVDNITFSVAKGDIVGFLGPNGAGKTTTMRILTCFIPATSGKALVGGHDIFQESLEVRRKVGYMPENVPLYTDMRVREYLTFRAKLKRVARSLRKKRIESVIERCWLGDVRERIVGQLSKGYRQRLGLAEAMLAEPAILILDEPTVGLDPNQIRKTRDLIRDLGREHTVILSTHILPEVEMVCNRVIIIDRGRIIAEDSVEGLKARRSGGMSVHLEVRGPTQEVEEALRGLEGVEALVRERAEGDLGAFRLTAGGGRDVREEIFRLVAAKGWVLRELHQEGASLEDIFVNITREEDVAEEEAA